MKGAPLSFRHDWRRGGSASTVAAHVIGLFGITGSDALEKVRCKQSFSRAARGESLSRLRLPNYRFAAVRHSSHKSCDISSERLIRDINSPSSPSEHCHWPHKPNAFIDRHLLNLLGSHFVEPREFIDNSVHVRVTHDSFQPLDIAGLG
jgi:hypothetical protein